MTLGIILHQIMKPTLRPYRRRMNIVSLDRLSVKWTCEVDLYRDRVTRRRSVHFVHVSRSEDEFNMRAWYLSC